MMIVTKIEDVVNELKNGSVIVYPTETCYGLGGDATNLEVVEKIYKIKQRREEKPFLVVVSDIATAMEYLEWNDNIDEIASKYWPGAVTVVGKMQNAKCKMQNGDNILQSPRPELGTKAEIHNLKLADGVVAPDGTIALRVTAHPVASALARGLGRPLISTSANISGQSPSYSSDEVIKMFENQMDQPDILIDAGELPRNPPTTIVRVEGEEIVVLRKGEIAI
jgi:L-threonylcarbamoyladenylate synthase